MDKALENIMTLRISLMSGELIPGHFLQVKVVMGLGWLERFGKHYFDRLSPPDFYTRVNIKDRMIYLGILVRAL